MITAEVRKMKSECWQSPWRGIGEDLDGRPLCYIMLNPDEMLYAANTGRIQVRDADIPERARRQRDRMRTFENLFDSIDTDLAKKVSLA